MTYRELYDQMLDECDTCEHCGRGGADHLRKTDPIAYRCGFNDYLDSISRDGLLCTECHKEDVESDDIRDSEYEDEILCRVCKGEQFYCAVCDDKCDAELGEDCDGDLLCGECAAEREDEDAD